MDCTHFTANCFQNMSVQPTSSCSGYVQCYTKNNWLCLFLSKSHFNTHRWPKKFSRM